MLKFFEGQDSSVFSSGRFFLSERVKIFCKIFLALDHVRSDHLQTFVESRYQRVKRLKTGGNIQCDFCSKFFDQKKDLKKHVSLAHPDKTNEDDVEEIYENSDNSHSMLRTALKKE